MIERWSREQVLALAPDASSQKGAQSVSAPAKWSDSGATPDVVWGDCKGSGASPYHACVDLRDPAYRCNCPSRKFPCKHALGLLLVWSAGGVPSADGPPAWVAEWLEQRRARAAEAASRAESAVAASTSEPGSVAEAGQGGPGPSGSPGSMVGAHLGESTSAVPGAAGRGGSGDASGGERRATQREERVAAGLSELERWLADQIAQGLATARHNAPAQWDDLTRRLVDAQAPGVAQAVSRLPRVLSDDDWPARLLGEYSLLNLLAVGHRRAAGLPASLRDTVRSRVGFPTSRDEVLAGETLRDQWDVLGQRDDEHDRLKSRRVWLRGRTSGRFALVLSFAPAGQALDASLVTGTSIDADLAFYPGASPLRALVAVRHRAVPAAPAQGGGVSQALGEVAAALEGDPWLESWPVVLGPVVPARHGDRWLLADPSPETPPPGGDRKVGGAPFEETPANGGPVVMSQSPGDRRGVDGCPLHPSVETPWRLLAVSGGHPLTVAAEWTPQGLRPLSTWDDEGRVVAL